MNATKHRTFLIIGPDDHVAVFEPQVSAPRHPLKGFWGSGFAPLGGLVGGGIGLKEEQGFVSSRGAIPLLGRTGGLVGQRVVRVDLGGHDECARFRWTAREERQWWLERRGGVPTMGMVVYLWPMAWGPGRGVQQYKGQVSPWR